MKDARILIIEDEMITALAIQRILENLGYMVTEILQSGEEAIEKIETLKPDLIIMDITLSGKIDGIEAAMRINKNSRIPIVYLTANTDHEIIQRAKESTQSYGYLLKPVSGIDLDWTIHTALKRRQLEDTV
jgi:CheY-like chemotaxis protein